MRSILGNSRKSDLTFWRDGHIDIRARVSRALDLKAGDVIDIAMGEGFNPDCYLYARRKGDQTTGRHEGLCRAVNGPRSRYLRANSRQLTRFVLQRMGEEERVCVACGEVTDTPLGLGIVMIGLTPPSKM